MVSRSWPGWAVLAGAGLAVGVAWVAVAAHPDALNTPGAAYVPIVLTCVLAGYGLVAVGLLRRPREGDVAGTWLGIAAGLMWCAEIAGGGPLLLSRSAEVANGATFSIAALVTTIAAGVMLGVRHGPRASLRAGLVAGLVSGEVVMLFAVPMTLLFLSRLGTRADYQGEFVTSHAPNMPAFLVQDALTGYGAHLLINPMLGLIGSGLGAVVGLAARSRRAAADTPTTVDDRAGRFPSPGDRPRSSFTSRARPRTEPRT
jgi:hypothetical protein